MPYRYILCMNEVSSNNPAFGVGITNLSKVMLCEDLYSNIPKPNNHAGLLFGLLTSLSGSLRSPNAMASDGQTC